MECIQCSKTVDYNRRDNICNECREGDFAELAKVGVQQKREPGIGYIHTILSIMEMEGISPFDLLTWEALLDLVGSLGPEGGVDIHLHYELRKQIEEAARRKADYLDKQSKSDFYSKVLATFEGA